MTAIKIFADDLPEYRPKAAIIPAGTKPAGTVLSAN